MEEYNGQEEPKIVSIRHASITPTSIDVICNGLCTDLVGKEKQFQEIYRICASLTADNEGKYYGGSKVFWDPLTKIRLKVSPIITNGIYKGDIKIYLEFPEDKKDVIFAYTRLLEQMLIPEETGPQIEETVGQITPPGVEVPGPDIDPADYDITDDDRKKYSFLNNP